MGEFTPRARARTQCNAEMKFAKIEAGVYVESRTYNFSEEGLYFETESPLEPESDVCIVMTKYAPDKTGPESYQSYFARTKWCRKLPHAGKPAYGIGVEFRGNCHQRPKIESAKICCCCDLCYHLVPVNEIHQMDEYVFLCNGCFEQLGGLPDGELKDSLERRILGNVI